MQIFLQLTIQPEKDSINYILMAQFLMNRHKNYSNQLNYIIIDVEKHNWQFILSKFLYDKNYLITIPKDFSVPCYFIFGNKDWMFKYYSEGAKRFIKKINNGSEMYVVNESGHNLTLD